MADDGSGDLVVRLHENLGGRTRAVLRIDAPATGVVMVDGLERTLGSAPLVIDDAGRVVVEMKPFQLATLRVRGTWV